MKRVLWFSCIGAVCIGAVAALEVGSSLLLYTIIGTIIEKIPVPDERNSGEDAAWAIIITIIGALAGTVTGAIAFGIAGIVSYCQTNASALLRKMSHKACWGSLIGWLLGGVTAGIGTAIWQYLTKNPQISIEAGVNLGVCVGFVSGVFSGAIKAARNANFN